MTPDIWLPPGARRFDADVEQAIADSSDPATARRLAEEMSEAGVTFVTEETFGSEAGPGSAVILLPREWGTIEKEDGTKALTAFVESKPLERMLMDGHVQYEGASVVDWAEHPLVHACCPALHLRLRQFQTFTPLEWGQCPCPVDWKAEVQRNGFTIAVPHPDPDETRHLYIATPPARPAHGLVLPGVTDRRVGRNEKCPCGSGLKFKRCCGG